MSTTRANSVLMRQAGFKRLYRVGSRTEEWVRGDLHILTGSAKLSLNTLVGYIIEQAVYWDRRNTHITNKGFKTSNK